MSENENKNRGSMLFIDDTWIDQDDQLIGLEIGDNHNAPVSLYNDKVILFAEPGTYSIGICIDHDNPSYGLDFGLPEGTKGFELSLQSDKTGESVLTMHSENGKMAGNINLVADEFSTYRLVFTGTHYNFNMSGYMVIVKVAETEESAPKRRLKATFTYSYTSDGTDGNMLGDRVVMQQTCVNGVKHIVKTVNGIVIETNSEDNITINNVEFDSSGLDAAIENDYSDYPLATFSGTTGTLIADQPSDVDSVNLDFESLGESDLVVLRDRLIKDGQALQFDKNTGQFRLDPSRLNPGIIKSLKNAVFQMLTEDDKKYLRSKLLKAGDGILIEDGVVKLDVDFIKNKVDEDCIDVEPHEIKKPDLLINRKVIEATKAIFGRKKKIAKKLNAAIDEVMWTVFDAGIERNRRRRGHYVIDNYVEDLMDIYKIDEASVNIGFDEVIESAKRWAINKSKVVPYEIARVGRWKVLRKISTAI